MNQGVWSGSVDRSVYSNVTVIVVVVVLVCVLCNVSPMISHMCWSLEDLLSDPKSRLIAYNYRILVTNYMLVCASGNSVSFYTYK